MGGRTRHPYQAMYNLFALWVGTLDFPNCFLNSCKLSGGLNSVLDGQLKPGKHLMKTIQKKVTTCIPVPELTNQGG
jgi:hypothetical protein